MKRVPQPNLIRAPELRPASDPLRACVRAVPQYGRMAADLRTVLAHPQVVALLLHPCPPHRSLLREELLPTLLLMQVQAPTEI